jgi:hypothetical protein
MVARDEPDPGLIQVSENAKARLRDLGWSNNQIQAALCKPKRGDRAKLNPGSDCDGFNQVLVKPRQLG